MIEYQQNNMWLFVVLFLMIFTQITCITIPNNPCPNIFTYQSNHGLYYGEIKLPYDGKKQLNLNVNVSLVGLYDNINVKLQLLTKLDDIESNTLLVYRVDFPVQNILPKITQIQYNGRIYCTGPPEPLSPRGVTNLWSNLQHFIYTSSMPFSIPTMKPGNAFLDNFNFNTIPRNEVAQTPAPTTLSTTTTTTTTTEFPQRASTTFNDCGIANDVQSLIINGEKTTDNEFPWLVAMFKRKGISYEFQCTSNLITDRHVITAAHCVQFYNAPLVDKDDMLFVLGNSNLTHWASSTTTVLRTAQKINVHPDYRQYTAHGDLVIIELNQPVVFKKEMHPICLWSMRINNGNNRFDNNGIVAGWGKDEKGQDTVPQPHKVMMPIVTQEECLRSNSAYNNLTSELTFCAGQRNNQGPCTGDSGAGFIIKYQNRWYLRGLVAIALKQANSFNCNLNEFVIFVDVFKLIDWIQGIINT